MKVCIVGAGAIGGWIGTRLALQGHAVSALARGDTLTALQRHGWRLEQAGQSLQAAAATVASRAEDIGPQDAVVIALKAPALAPLARSLSPLITPHTSLIAAMNGVPWWFFDGLDGFADLRLDSADPDGTLRAALGVAQVIGCVVHATCSTIEPGWVGHGFGDGLILGNAVGETSDAARLWTQQLSEAGFSARCSQRIQRDIWYKLWGNMTMNPVSALTGATSDQLIDDPLVYAMCLRAMAEAARIGERIGCPVDGGGEARMAVARKLGAFKTSMLQDVEAGKPLEIDALLSVVREIGQKLDIATPTVDDLLGLTRLFGRVRGLYPA